MTDGRIGPGKLTVIKLDVEGVEVEALRGASTLFWTDAVFICEEHGSDKSHLVSRHLLNHTDLRLFAFDDQTRRFVRVEDLAVLDRIKRFSWVGYNVFATKSDLWESKLVLAS